MQQNTLNYQIYLVYINVRLIFLKQVGLKINSQAFLKKYNEKLNDLFNLQIEKRYTYIEFICN